MNKPLTSWNLFAQEKRLEGLKFEEISKLWKGPEGEKWREAHVGPGEMLMPSFEELLWPSLQVLKEAGEPLSKEEHLSAVLQLIKLPDKVKETAHGSGPQSEIEYRLGRSRLFLAKEGAIEKMGRDKWKITPHGEELTEEEIANLPFEMRPYERIQETIRDMESRGEVPSEDSLQGYYRRFREKFGPEVLASLDGEELLTLMHDHSDHDSLVYWLEFKDDEEFPALFGSIAGGSALKFGIYRRKETGKWIKGHPSKQVELSVQDAINVARLHRDQLLSGAELLEKLPAEADEHDYQALDEAMIQEAPDVAFKAWGHKYFSLIFPEKIDDFHSFQLQQFHLTKMLIEPPENDGRYLAAHSFMKMATELGIYVRNLTSALIKIHPVWHKYWRIGTKLGGKKSIWQEMKNGHFIAVGWSKIEDLKGYNYSRDNMAKLKGLLINEYSSSPQIAGNQARQILSFSAGMQEEDLVLACDGRFVLGIGKVTGDYEYHPNSEFPHRRPAEWLSLEKWEMPVWKGLVRSTVRQVGHHKYRKTLMALERRLLEDKSEGDKPPTGVTIPPDPLMGIPARIKAILDRKRQVILYGPPGTGKTYWAMKTARELAARTNFKSTFDNLNDNDRKEILGTEENPGLVRTCCFHPEYGYENFIEGYSPKEKNGQVIFNLEDGIFKRICSDALREGNGNKSFFLIIDEINRGDIPRIFGELLMLLESDKRGQNLTLPVSKQSFQVPNNVNIIGTMNTADRSIALLDTALRRRFGFVELMPDSTVLEDVVFEGVPLRQWLDALNKRIRDHIGQDARNLQIGHSYFMPEGKSVQTITDFFKILQDDIIPLLEEYCYEDYSLLTKILGSAFVDEKKWRIRHDLFERSAREKLVQALLAPNPEIATSDKSVEADEEQEEDINEASVDNDTDTEDEQA